MYKDLIGNFKKCSVQGWGSKREVDLVLCQDMVKGILTVAQRERKRKKERKKERKKRKEEEGRRAYPAVYISCMPVEDCVSSSVSLCVCGLA